MNNPQLKKKKQKKKPIINPQIPPLVADSKKKIQKFSYVGNKRSYKKKQDPCQKIEISKSFQIKKKKKRNEGIIVASMNNIPS